MPHRKIVLQSHASEYPVAHADARRFCRHEAANLRHKRDDGDLADVGRFARHVGARQYDELLAVACQRGVVGDEIAGRQHALDDGMPTLLDGNRVAVVEDRAHIAMPRRHFRERCESVDVGDGARGAQYRLGVARNLLTDLPEERGFHLADTVLRVQDERLVLLHFGRDEALAAHKRLPPHIVVGRLLEVGIANFDVIAEHAVVADLQRLDAGALAFLVFQPRDVVLRVAGCAAHLVEFGREALPNHIAVAHAYRRVVRDSLPDELDDLAVVRDPLREPVHLVRIVVFAQQVFDFRRGVQAVGKTNEVARRGVMPANPVHQPFHVGHQFEQHHDALSPQRASMEPFHGVLPPQ